MADTLESRSTRRPSRRTTWVVVCVLALGLLAALPFAWHWWTHPHLIQGSGHTRTFVAPAKRAEAAVAVAITSAHARGDPVTVTWHGARVVLPTNTARARASFSVCDTGPEFVRPAGVILDPDRALNQFCTAVRPLTDGDRLTYPNPRQVVILTLRPTRPGRVHMTEVDVTYSLGVEQLFRHGTDHLAFDVHFSAH